MTKDISKLQNLKITLPIPVFGIGCGVLGLSLAKVSVNLGKHASTLLRALEYRGYDSTGAVFQDDKQNIVLLKDVGAPSTLVKTLGIEKQKGKLFCGQVRWATFGFVNKVNAQPHDVSCKRHIYGAHNGNITNTRELKTFLLHEGHNVRSDNDGEMLVHAVEHYFDIEMDKNGNKETPEDRKHCMRRAIAASAEMIIGSYAAVVVDPVTETMWAIKAGSSLYFGIGNLEGQKFALASSDLTAVLRFTKTLVPFREGEFVEFSADTYQLYAQKELKFKRLNQPNETYKTLEMINALPVYSKLRAEDVELLPEFSYFMEQEIYAQPESTGKLIKLFQGGSNSGKHMLRYISKEKLLTQFEKLLKDIRKADTPADKKKLFDTFNKTKAAENFYSLMRSSYPAIYEEAVKEDFEKKYFFSSDKKHLHRTHRKRV
jgi:glutamine---fructose-6-phosphate transaminase (isomerizing)